MAKKNNHAFTLIELLVVISILGLLIGILLPALSSAREQGRCVVCKSNLRNIGLALRFYLDDHEGKMPSGEPYPGAYGEKSQHWFMNEELMDHLEITIFRDEAGELIGPGKERSVLTCPTHRHPDMTRDSPPEYPAEPQDYSLSYMANGTLGLSGKCSMPMEYRRENEYLNPSRSMMFCDGNGTKQVPGIVLFDGCPKENFDYRHRKQVNVVFLDQHLEACSEKEIPFFSRFEERRFGEFWYAKKK